MIIRNITRNKFNIIIDVIDINEPSNLLSDMWTPSEKHVGQSSLSYSVLCRLGEIFSPGMSCLDDGNFCYEQLEKIASLEL